MKRKEFIGMIAGIVLAPRKKKEQKIVINSNSDADYRTFMGAGVERMRITSSGNVGIGVVPSQKLHVFDGIIHREV